MFKKYKNSDPACQYPFENDALGYCWGYARGVDCKITKEEQRRSCLICDCYKDSPYYNDLEKQMKDEKEFLSEIREITFINWIIQKYGLKV